MKTKQKRRSKSWEMREGREVCQVLGFQCELNEDYAKNTHHEMNVVDKKRGRKRRK